MDAFDNDGEWRKAYEGGKYFRQWAGQLGYNWKTWAEHGNEASIDQTSIWASKAGNRGVGRPEIDSRHGINWEELDRENILEKYGPDPTVEAETEWEGLDRQHILEEYRPNPTIDGEAE